MFSNNGAAARGLVLLQALLEDEVLQSLRQAAREQTSSLLAQRLAGRRLQAGENAAAAYLLPKLLGCDGLFSRRAAAGLTTPALLQQMAAELRLIQGWVGAYQTPDWLYCPEEAAAEAELQFADWEKQPAEQLAADLAEFHHRQGFGPLSLGRIWRWEGKLLPVSQYDGIKITDLVGYQSQKDEVLANLRLFAQEGRGNNMLLYGARGTGKSSLVKAAANELAAEGLCLVELPLEHMASLPQLLALLQPQPRRYLLFIDDLSFERADQSYKITKAVLEGSVTTLGQNVLICATSNRRHLIVENWQDREGVEHLGGEVRASDSMSEKLSLADRFGLTVLFSVPRQEEYVQIATALAEADGISLPPEELRRRALQWALWQKHNGQSGRTARQFVNSLPSGSPGGLPSGSPKEEQ